MVSAPPALKKPFRENVRDRHVRAEITKGRNFNRYISETERPRKCLGWQWATSFFFCPTKLTITSENTLLVMAGEESGSHYARVVGQKGLGDGQEMSWLVKGMCTQLKA